MKVAICFDGVDDEAFAARAAEVVRGYESLEAWCAFGDSAERLAEEIAERHHGPPHPPRPAHHASLDEDQANAIARHGAALLARRGVTAVPRTLRGRNAEHALAEASGTGVLLVLSAGHRGGIGPHSVGHVARFVVDHARGPVLVVRA